MIATDVGTIKHKRKFDAAHIKLVFNEENATHIKLVFMTSSRQFKLFDNENINIVYIISLLLF